MPGPAYTANQYVPAPTRDVWLALDIAVKSCSDLRVVDANAVLHRMEIRKPRSWTSSPMTFFASVRPDGNGSLVTVEAMVTDAHTNTAYVVKQAQKQAVRLLAALDPAARQSQSSSFGQSVQAGPADHAARLESLTDLRDRGLITPEEYQRRRAAIIDEI